MVATGIDDPVDRPDPPVSVSTSAQPTFTECRQATRSVRQAEGGRQAIGYLRPRGIGGLYRERPPLAVLLYLLSRQNLVVWRSPDEFIALRPPDLPDATTTSGDRPAVRLRRLDRWWNTLVMWLPPFSALLLVIPFAFVPTLRLPALLLVIIVGFLYPAIVMLSLALHALLWLYRRLTGSVSGRQTTSALLTEQNWSVSLCHIVDSSRTEEVFRAARTRVRQLAASPEPDQTHSITATLVCNERCITTSAARQAAHIATEVTRITEPGANLLILREPGDESVPSVGVYQPDPVYVVSIYSFFVAISIAIQAYFVSDYERTACGTRCDGRPDSYGEAVYWLLNRLVLLGDPEDLAPATVGVRMVGVTTALLGMMTIAVVVASGVRVVRARTKNAQEVEEKIRQTLESSARAAWGSVFINYRQGLEDLSVAGLYRTLSDRFGSDKVFFDNESMPPGTPYPDELRTKLNASTVLLAVIPQGWLECLNERQKSAGPDWVRFEISTALQADKTVIPVLLNDATLPTADQLPDEMAKLAHRQICHLRWRFFGEDLARLVTAIEPHLRIRN